MAVCHNLVPLVNIKIAGKWMFIPLKIVLIGIDPYPFEGLTMGIYCLSCSCHHKGDSDNEPLEFYLSPSRLDTSEA